MYKMNIGFQDKNYDLCDTKCFQEKLTPRTRDNASIVAQGAVAQLVDDVLASSSLLPLPPKVQCVVKVIQLTSIVYF